MLLQYVPPLQAPDTIKREAAGGGAGGELYTVVDKPKKGGKKANDKNEDDVAQLYAMPDKSKKKQNQDQGVRRYTMNLSIVTTSGPPKVALLMELIRGQNQWYKHYWDITK